MGNKLRCLLTWYSHETHDTYDTHDVHDTHGTRDTHDTHDPQGAHPARPWGHPAGGWGLVLLLFGDRPWVLLAQTINQALPWPGTHPRNGPTLQTNDGWLPGTLCSESLLSLLPDP